MAASALEQRMSKPAQYLRDHRLQLTGWIAVPEGILVAFGVIPHLIVYVLAVVGIAFWFTAARNYRSASARQASWIFAVSQAISVLVPVVMILVGWALVTAITVIAAVALILLFAERKRL